MFANKTDPILLKYKDHIKNFGYASNRITDFQSDWPGKAKTCYSDRARIAENRVKNHDDLCKAVLAISPSRFFDVQLQLPSFNIPSGLGTAE